MGGSAILSVAGAAPSVGQMPLTSREAPQATGAGTRHISLRQLIHPDFVLEVAAEADDTLGSVCGDPTCASSRGFESRCGHSFV
ncbi:unnamed protein product, partial [Brenthis ino]